MADRDAESQRASFERAASGAGRVRGLFRGVDLDLVLKAGERSVLIDHQRGRQQSPSATRSVPRMTVILALAAAERWRTMPDRENLIGRRHRLADRSIAWDEAFGKADDSGRVFRGFEDGPLGERDRLEWGGRKPQVGKCESDHVHVHYSRKRRAVIVPCARGAANRRRCLRSDRKPSHHFQRGS